MDIIKIIGIGIMALIIAVIIKQNSIKINTYYQYSFLKLNKLLLEKFLLT